jgi:Zn finger protein HypA/HybF involved in hydrogenase expression
MVIRCFKCNICNRYFDEPIWSSVDGSEEYYTPAYVFEKAICPICGSENFELTDIEEN